MLALKLTDHDSAGAGLFEHTHFGHFFAFWKTLVYSWTVVDFHFNNSSIRSFRSFLWHTCGIQVSIIRQYSFTKTKHYFVCQVNKSDVWPIRGKNKTAVQSARRTQQGPNKPDRRYFIYVFTLYWALLVLASSVFTKIMFLILSYKKCNCIN